MNIVATVKKETAKAILIETAEGEEQWIPKSVITDLSLDEGESGEIEVADWFAEKECLE